MTKDKRRTNDWGSWGERAASPPSCASLADGEVKRESPAPLDRATETDPDLVEVFRNNRYELFVSIAAMTFLIVLAATGIYFVEADEQPEAFGSIPRAMWWSVATLTTVGYGDVAPVTAWGKTLAAFVSLLGIALVAIPTGILAASFSEVIQKRGKESREPGDKAA